MFGKGEAPPLLPVDELLHGCNMHADSDNVHEELKITRQLGNPFPTA